MRMGARFLTAFAFAFAFLYLPCGSLPATRAERDLVLRDRTDGQSASLSKVSLACVDCTKERGLWYNDNACVKCEYIYRMYICAPTKTPQHRHPFPHSHPAHQRSFHSSASHPHSR